MLHSLSSKLYMSQSPLLSMAKKPFSRQVLALMMPYWQKSNEKLIAWALLLTIIALNYTIVEVAVMYSNWNRDFFNLMQNEEWENFWSMLGTFVLIMGGYTCIDLLEEYLRRGLRIRWRRWLTYTYLNAWIDGKRLYRHQVLFPNSDNPDQRISQDIQAFCDTTLRMGLGLLRTVTSLFSFTVILWNLSGTLEFEFAGSEWAIPGYMVWVAIVYSIVGTWLTHKLAKRLIPLNFEQEKSEANFRFHMMRMREHAESISMQRGETAEQARTQALFGKVWDNWQQLTGLKLRYAAFNSGYNEVARIFPYLVASPRLMSGSLQLGDMMQTATGFYKVQEAFSWFVDSYESIADWKAITDRLVTFHSQLESIEEAKQHKLNAHPQWSNLTICSPQANTILEKQTGEFTDHSIIRGPSGGGKSTLLRTLAGIWPYYQGEVAMPEASQCQFIPQKPYLPHSSLKAILSYPQDSETYTDKVYVHALELVGLTSLTKQLEEVTQWQARLSGGELQKVMIARALVQKPTWLLLDESFSALDPESYRSLTQVLAEQLSECRIIEVSHRESSERLAGEFLFNDGQIKPQ